jgi:hypothetical protein
VIKSKRQRFVEHVERKGQMINAYNILIGKPEGKITVWENYRYMGR